MDTVWLFVVVFGLLGVLALAALVVAFGRSALVGGRAALSAWWRSRRAERRVTAVAKRTRHARPRRRHA